MINTKFKSIANKVMNVSTDFDTGSGANLKLDDNIITLETVSDPITSQYTVGYDYYFHISIKNISSKKMEFSFIVLRPKSNLNEIDWKPSKAPIFCSNDKKEWFYLPNVLASENHMDYKGRISIPRGKTVYLSNNIPINPLTVSKRMKTLSQKHYVKNHVIGKSVLGNAIELLEIDENPKLGKDTFLIWSGIHPSEPDPIASFWLIDWILSDLYDAKKARQKYKFQIVPMINPDGFILGTSGCNANGINIFWDFLMDDTESSPESTAIWGWIKNNPPAISWDIHAYIYQTEKAARPYIPTIMKYPINLRRPAWKVYKSLKKICNNQAVTGKTIENISFSNQMIKNFGTIVLPGYHYHLADGPAESKEFIINSLTTIINSLSKFSSLNVIKKQKIPKYDFYSHLWKLREFIFDRYPRKVFTYLKINKKKRLDIDLSRNWKKYGYNLSDGKPVSSIEPDSIN